MRGLDALKRMSGVSGQSWALSLALLRGLDRVLKSQDSLWVDAGKGRPDKGGLADFIDGGGAAYEAFVLDVN